MIEPYIAAKYLHVLSSTILFGTGLGTAFHMWLAHRSGEPTAIAVAARSTVLADWMFTATSGVAQLLSGIALVHFGRIDMSSSWLVSAIVLYVIALGCWLPVVAIQIKVRDIARDCVATDRPLPLRYDSLMRLWMALGWPAFTGLLVVFYLMIAKPDLW